MKRILTLIFAIGIVAGAAAQDNDATLKSYSTNQIGTKPYSPTRADVMNQAIIDSKTNIIYGVTAAGTDTYTATVSATVVAYTTGQHFLVKFTNANTGPSTINFNSIGAVTIQKAGSALSAGDIPANSYKWLAHDGTYFQIVGDGGSAGTGTVNSGTQYRIPYYATTGTALSEASAITGSRALKSDANGVPTHFDTATEPSLAELAYVKGVTSAIQTQFEDLEDLISGGYADVTFVNSYSGVDYTGATDSKTGLQAALDAGFSVVVFDGLYRTTEELNIASGQTVILRGGTAIQLYGNVNTGVALFELNNNSHILAEPGARLYHTPTGTASYSGIYVTSKTGWSIQGKMTIDSFGNQGIRILGTPSSPNQYRNGIIKDVICKGNINNGFGGSSGAGHGIEVTTAEYVFILDVDCYDNAGYGIYFDRVANSPINNTRMIGNTLGGLRIDGDYSANTDHFHVSNCQINHNDDTGAFNVYVKDVDTGVNFNGCSIYGGIPFKVENSRGVSFTGCGMADGTSGDPVIIPGADGDGIVNINGGHVLYSTETLRETITGGGSVVLNNVMETVITEHYSSNFSAGADSWTASGTTVTGNIDAISDGATSFDNTLRMVGDAASSEHYEERTTTLTSGNRYKIYITVYIPTANATCDGLRIADSGGYSYDFDSYNLVPGRWVTVQHEFTATGTTLQLKALSGTSVSFTMAATDYVYIARIKIWEL